MSQPNPPPPPPQTPPPLRINLGFFRSQKEDRFQRGVPLLVGYADPDAGPMDLISSVLTPYPMAGGPGFGYP